MTSVAAFRLQPHSLYAALSWQRARELSGRPPYSWITVTAGTVVRGTMPLYLPEQTANSRYSPGHLLREVGLAAGARVVLAGGLSGYQCDLLVAVGYEPGPVGVELLSRAQQETSADLVVIPYLTSVSAAALARDPGCAILTEDLDSYLEQFDDGLAGFVSRARSRQRRAIRVDLATFADRGFSTGRRPLAGFEERFAVLVDANTRKYGGADDIPSLTSLLRAIADVYGPNATLITATYSGAVIGAVLAIAHQDCLYLRMIGFDYTLTENSGAYFQLAFYQPISLAQQLGLARVHLGIEMNGTKFARGATTRPLWTAVYGLAAEDVRAANRRRLHSLCARVPGRQASAFIATVARELDEMGIELDTASMGT
jgi:hypothetical protein